MLVFSVTTENKIKKKKNKIKNVGIQSINGIETSWQSVILMTHPHRHICLAVSLWKLLLFRFYSTEN